MVLNDLIAKLEELRAQHGGDVPVVTQCLGYDWGDEECDWVGFYKGDEYTTGSDIVVPGHVYLGGGPFWDKTNPHWKKVEAV